MVYRRTVAEAPARYDEILHTREEGIEMMELTNPVEAIGENGKLTSVKCEIMKLGEPDESGRRRPVGTGEFKTLPCDNLVLAISTSYSEDVVGTTKEHRQGQVGQHRRFHGGATLVPACSPAGDAVTRPGHRGRSHGNRQACRCEHRRYLSNL